MPWADGAEVIVRLLQQQADRQRGQSMCWDIGVHDCKHQFCPSGCAVVDPRSLCGFGSTPVLVDGTSFTAGSSPVVLRTISECDVCHNDEHRVTIGGQRFCLTCLHRDAVPTAPVSVHLSRLIGTLENVGEVRLVVAHNQDGQPIALLQHSRGRHWHPVAVELFAGSNGGDLYDFVMASAPFEQWSATRLRTGRPRKESA